MTTEKPGPDWFGLKTTETTYSTLLGDDETTVVRRTEPFVVDVTDYRGNRSTGYLWRSETIYPVDERSVRYDGFSNGGRRALHYSGDAEAKKSVRTHRVTRKVLVPATADAGYDEAADRYRLMMSY